MAGKHDWSSVDLLTEDEIHAAAVSDPDAQPITPERLAHMKPVAPIASVRRALRLTQEEFAAEFQIPLGTLRDWEQGRTEPDQPAKAYLRVIASNPDLVRAALRHPAATEVTRRGGA